MPTNLDVEETAKSDESEIREFLQIQACLAEIGSRLSQKMWPQKSERVRVLKIWKPDDTALGVVPDSFQR